MIPIIIRPHKFGGKGKEDNLFSVLTLEILCKNNEDTIIYLIDIDGNLGKITHNLQNRYTNLKYFNYEDYKYSDKILQFEEKYIHLSSNPISLELNGILSFFYIEKFVNDNHLNNFYIFENDVIINYNMNKLADEFNFKINKSHVYLSNKCVLGASLCNKQYIEFYVSTVIKCYSTQKIVDTMRNVYNRMQEGGKSGGINDMTFNDWIRHNRSELHQEKIFEIMNLNKYTDEIIIDNNIKTQILTVDDQTIEFTMKKTQMCKEYKELYINHHKFYEEEKYYDNSIVYYKPIDIKNKKMYLNNREVAITHFGGNSKLLIPEFYDKLFL